MRCGPLSLGPARRQTCWEPVCYASKTLDRAQANCSVTEKECLAMVWPADLFRTLLLAMGHQFVLQTNHSALKQLLTNKTATGRLARWAMKLQEFDMTVFHRKGEDQGNAGFLSWLRHNLDGTFTVNRFQSGGISPATVNLYTTHITTYASNVPSAKTCYT